MTPREFVIWLKGFANGKTYDARGRPRNLRWAFSKEDITRIIEMLQKVDMSREKDQPERGESGE